MDVGCTLELDYTYRLGLWAPTSASCKVSAVAKRFVLVYAIL